MKASPWLPARPLHLPTRKAGGDREVTTSSQAAPAVPRHCQRQHLAPPNPQRSFFTVFLLKASPQPSPRVDNKARLWWHKLISSAGSPQAQSHCSLTGISKINYEGKRVTGALFPHHGLLWIWCFERKMSIQIPYLIVQHCGFGFFFVFFFKPSLHSGEHFGKPVFIKSIWIFFFNLSFQSPCTFQCNYQSQPTIILFLFCASKSLSNFTPRSSRPSLHGVICRGSKEPQLSPKLLLPSLPYVKVIPRNAWVHPTGGERSHGSHLNHKDPARPVQILKIQNG